jgi:hypothetical protein
MISMLIDFSGLSPRDRLQCAIGRGGPSCRLRLRRTRLGGMTRRDRSNHFMCRSSEASSLPKAGDMSASDRFRTVWSPLSSTVIV